MVSKKRWAFHFIFSGVLGYCLPGSCTVKPRQCKIVCFNYVLCLLLQLTVIKGRVELIDELNTQVEYVVKVLQVIKQGNKNVNVGEAMHLWRSSTCHSPDLKKYKEYLFMGLDNRNHYQLDKNSFVKLWPKRPANNKDKKVLEDFARQYASGAKCKN